MEARSFHCGQLFKLAHSQPRESNNGELFASTLPPKREHFTNGDIMEDRLSSLPDGVLIRILEQLPLPTAIMVCRLSRRWLRLWTWMSKLSFDQSSQPALRDFSNFASFVDTALLHCHPELLRAISIEMNSESDHRFKLPDWLDFTCNNNVKELELSCGYRGESELPMALCVNSCILKLKLNFQEIIIPTSVYWKSLRYLTLERIIFPNPGMMVKILAGCPVLEELEMEQCMGVCEFDFSSAVSLKKFSMTADLDEPNVNIYCGNLQCLVIRCGLYFRMYYLHAASSLREVVLMCDELLEVDEEEGPCVGEKNYAKDIICSLSDVEKLTVGFACLEVFSYFNDKSLPSPLPKLRNLVVDVHFSDMDMVGLAAMLRSCPSLEILTIELSNLRCLMCNGCYREDVEHEFEEPMETYWMSQDVKAFQCLRMNLKIVKITGFGLYDCEECNVVQFIEFILKHALMLEELWVIAEKLEKREKAEKRLTDIARTLLKFKRSSPFVKIVLN